MCVFSWSATFLTRENIADSFVPMPMPLVLSCMQLGYPQTSHLQCQHFLMTYARQSRSACVTTLMVYPHRAARVCRMDRCIISCTTYHGWTNCFCFPQTESKSVEARRVRSRKWDVMNEACGIRTSRRHFEDNWLRRGRLQRKPLLDSP